MYGRQFKINNSYLPNRTLTNISTTDYLTILNSDYTENKLLLFKKPLSSSENNYTLENNILTVSDIIGIVTKIEFNGLKRKDNGQRYFVGEIACYLDSDNNPFLFKVDRTNSDHPTITTIRGFDEYKDTYEIEKRTKGVQIYFEHL